MSDSESRPGSSKTRHTVRELRGYKLAVPLILAASRGPRKNGGGRGLISNGEPVKMFSATLPYGDSASNVSHRQFAKYTCYRGCDMHTGKVYKSHFCPSFRGREMCLLLQITHLLHVQNPCKKPMFPNGKVETPVQTLRL